MWLTVLRTSGWLYAMFRPLMLIIAWVYAIVWVMFGPLNILNALCCTVKFNSIEIALAVGQFVLGIYLMRYLWRSSGPPRQETVRLGESDA